MTWDLIQNGAAVNQLKAMQFFTCCGSKRVSAHVIQVKKTPQNDHTFASSLTPPLKNGWHLKMTPGKKINTSTTISANKTKLKKPTKPTFRNKKNKKKHHLVTRRGPRIQLYSWSYTVTPTFVALYIGSFRNFESGVLFLPYLYNMVIRGPSPLRRWGLNQKMARHLGGTFRVEGINSRSHFTLVLGFEELNKNHKKNTERTGPLIWRW